MNGWQRLISLKQIEGWSEKPDTSLDERLCQLTRQIEILTNRIDELTSGFIRVKDIVIIGPATIMISESVHINGLN